MKKYFLGYLITCGLLPLSLGIAEAQPYTFSPVAGMAGISGAVDGTNGVARFNYPNGIALDSLGNVYVSDSTQGIVPFERSQQLGQAGS